LSNQNVIYKYDDRDRQLDITFRADQSVIDYRDLSIDNISEGYIDMFMSVYVGNDVLQYKRNSLTVCITPYGDFVTLCDIQTTTWLYNEWLYKERAITSTERKEREDILTRVTCESAGAYNRSSKNNTQTPPRSSSGAAHPTNVALRFEITDEPNNWIFLSGHVEWSDALGNEHPARQVLIELRRSVLWADELIVDFLTDDIGKFWLSIPKVSGMYFKVFAATNVNLGVSDFWGNRYSFSTTSISALNAGSYVAEITGTNTADAFYVHQAIIVGSDYAKANNCWGKPIVTFPRSKTQYNPVTETIWIIEDDYCDFDVVLHEYGHYVAHKLDIDESPGGSHAWTKILTDKLKHKGNGIKFAWGEGWASYFSISSQLHQNVAALNIHNAGDTYYDDTIDGSTHMDIKNGTNGRGEGNELAVARALLNLTYTGTSASPILSYQQLWDLVRMSKCKHLSDFMAQVYANTSKSQISAIGSILRSQNVVPSLITAADSEIDYNNPIFSWSINAGTPTGTRFVSETYLDEFTLVFYDTSFNKINFEVPTQKDSPYVLKNNHSHTLTPNQLNSFKSLVPYDFYWGIKVNQYDKTVNTGSYYSELRRMARPTFIYSLYNSDTEYSVDGLDNQNATVLSIPSTYKGKPVTRIGNFAFNSCSSITHVTLPTSIKTIGEYAFAVCSKLTDISIPDNVISIGESAFYNSGLEHVYFSPESKLQSFGSGVFFYCNNLRSIELPFVGATKNGISNTHFGYIFSAPSYLYPIFIPQQLTNVTIFGGNSIPSNAFYGCDKIEEIRISYSVTSIGGNAFQGCSGLTTVYVERPWTTSITGTSLGTNAFSGCDSLSTIFVPDFTSATKYKAPTSDWFAHETKIRSVDGFLGNFTGTSAMQPFYTADTYMVQFTPTQSGWYKMYFSDIDFLEYHFIWVPYYVSGETLEIWLGAGAPFIVNFAATPSSPSTPGQFIIEKDDGPTNPIALTGDKPRYSFESGTHTVTFTPSENGTYKLYFCDIDACKTNTISVSGPGVSVQDKKCSTEVTLQASETYTITFTATQCGSKQGQFKIDKVSNSCTPCPPCNPCAPCC